MSLLERDDVPTKMKMTSAQDALSGRSCWNDFELEGPESLVRLSVLETLMSLEGIDPNFLYNGKTLLHKCMEVSWLSDIAIETIKLLYRHGADPNIKDKNSQSCLAKAVTVDWGSEWPPVLGILKVTIALVDTYDRLIDLESQDERGRTPLHCATMSAVALVNAPYMGDKCEAIVRFLLDVGAKYSAQESAGRTPFSYAVQLSHVTLVQMFLSRGAEADYEDNSGRTPLSHAVDFDPQSFLRLYDRPLEEFVAQWPPASLKEVVDILLLNGADPNFRDHHGMTPLLRAEKTLPEDHEVLKMLRNSTSN